MALYLVDQAERSFTVPTDPRGQDSSIIASKDLQPELFQSAAVQTFCVHVAAKLTSEGKAPVSRDSLKTPLTL